jgi:ABC-type Fe3+ transport system substrate-binding protein
MARSEPALRGIGLGANPIHPNTGKLFIDFVASTKAQTIIREMHRIPAAATSNPWRQKSIRASSSSKRSPNEYAREFRKIFGL